MKKENQMGRLLPMHETSVEQQLRKLRADREKKKFGRYSVSS